MNWGRALPTPGPVTTREEGTKPVKSPEEAEIFVANTSAVFTHQGATYRIVKNQTTARRGAKILDGREHMFKPLVIDFDVPQEQKRGPGRPRKHPVEEPGEQKDILARV